MILIADDEDLNRKVLAAMCGAQGYRTREVANGWQAVEAASRDRYAVILMDIMMPVMDGLEATRRIRTLPEPMGRTRIIGVTALDRGTLEPEGRHAGMNAVLYKPLRMAHLTAMLRHCGGCTVQDCSVPAGP